MLATNAIDLTRPGWRCKRMNMVSDEEESTGNHSGARRSCSRKGSSAVKLMEPAMFLWRGPWPNELRVTGRQDNGLMGSTRDDQWRPCKSPDFKSIRKFPKRLRTGMMADIWESMKKKQNKGRTGAGRNRRRSVRA
jgi:hypothetical protein